MLSVVWLLVLEFIEPSFLKFSPKYLPFESDVERVFLIHFSSTFRAREFHQLQGPFMGEGVIVEAREVGFNAVLAAATDENHLRSRKF